MILLLTVISCSNLRDGEVVETIDPVEFMNFVLTDTTDLNLVSDGYNVISDIQILPPPIMPAGEFSDFLLDKLEETDTLFIIEQLEKNTFRIDELEQYGFTVVKVSKAQAGSDEFWNYIYNNFGQGLLTVSKPIFNKSFSKVFVRVGYVCGPHCGGGQEVILEKTAGKWKIKEITGI